MIRSASASTEARRTHALESGTQASGAVPRVLLSHSPASALETSAGSLATMSTLAQVPRTSGLVPDHFWLRPCMIDSIRGVTTTVAVAWPEQPALIRYA